MNPTNKKLISLLLVFSLLILSLNLYAKERRGAKLIVTKLDGQLIKGELITVKPNSLLLLDTEGKDVAVDITDIKVIRIVKKSKALLGAGLGFIIGAVPGAIAGSEITEALWGWLSTPEGKRKGAAIGAVIGGLAFGIIGVIVAGTGKTFQIEEMTDSEIQEALDKLRKKARIRDHK